MAENTKFKCEFCKQDYASYKSRWLHIKKYHDIKPVENRKSHKKISQNTVYSCEYCKKIYSRKDSLTRHQTDYCKNKSKNLTETNNQNIILKQNQKIEKLNKLLIEQSKKIEELTNFMMNQSNVKNIEI
jgi:hypothetical protein